MSTGRILEKEAKELKARIDAESGIKQPKKAKVPKADAEKPKK